MTRTTLIFAAAAALAIPAIASAEPKPDASTANPATTAHAPRYCVVDTPTGSNIQRKTCKSLEAWLADGFDPRAKK